MASPGPGGPAKQSPMDLCGYLLVLMGLITMQLPAGSLYAFSSVAQGLKGAGFGHQLPVPLLGAAGNLGTCSCIRPASTAYRDSTGPLHALPPLAPHLPPP